MNTDERIFELVNAAKKKSKRAEADFDRAQSRISIKAESEIKLNSGNAVRQVSEIASLSRKACDDLYSTYQSLVKLIDEETKPLLAQNPSAYAIKEVAELIKWLNKESEIGANFSGSFNGRSLGDMVDVKYFPSIENKMIENYWSSKYELMPETEKAEAENKYQNNKKIEQEAQKDELKAYREAELEIYKDKIEEKKRIKETAEANSRIKEVELSNNLKELRAKYQIAARWLAIGDNHVLIRNEDGTVTAIGKNNFKQCDVSSWTDVVQVAAHRNMSLGLTSSGSIYTTGSSNISEMSIRSIKMWSGIKQIAIGDKGIWGVDGEGKIYSTAGANGAALKMPVEYIYAYDNLYIIYKDGTGDFGDEKYLDLSPSNWNLVCITDTGMVKIIGKKAGSLSADVINTHGGIVKVVNFGGRPIGITYEGTIIIGRGENLNATDPTYNRITKFINSYDDLKNGRIVALACKSDEVLVFLSDKGKLFSFKNRGYSDFQNIELTQIVKKPFNSFDIAIDKIINHEKYIAQAQREAEKRAAQWMSEGRCQYCGSLLKKGIFGYKCTSCGRKKDY